MKKKMPRLLARKKVPPHVRPQERSENQFVSEAGGGLDLVVPRQVPDWEEDEGEEGAWAGYGYGHGHDDVHGFHGLGREGESERGREHALGSVLLRVLLLR